MGRGAQLLALAALPVAAGDQLLLAVVVVSFCQFLPFVDILASDPAGSATALSVSCNCSALILSLRGQATAKADKVAEMAQRVLEYRSALLLDGGPQRCGMVWKQVKSHPLQGLSLP